MNLKDTALWKVPLLTEPHLPAGVQNHRVSRVFCPWNMVKDSGGKLVSKEENVRVAVLDELSPASHL